MCMPKAPTSTTRTPYYVSASLWLDMRLEDFGRSTYASLRTAARASLKSEPDEIVITVAEYVLVGTRVRALASSLKLLPPPRNTANVYLYRHQDQQQQQHQQKQQHHHHYLATSSSSSSSSSVRDVVSGSTPGTGTTGVQVNLTAYYRSADEAVRAAAAMTSEQLTRQIVAAGLPSPVIMQAPRAVVDHPGHFYNDNGELSSVHLGLIIGLIVGILVCVCLGLFAFYYMRARQQELCYSAHFKLDEVQTGQTSVRSARESSSTTLDHTPGNGGTCPGMFPSGMAFEGTTAGTVQQPHTHTTAGFMYPSGMFQTGTEGTAGTEQHTMPGEVRAAHRDTRPEAFCSSRGQSNEAYSSSAYPQMMNSGQGHGHGQGQAHGDSHGYGGVGSSRHVAGVPLSGAAAIV
jgi:hypothetical protein